MSGLFSSLSGLVQNFESGGNYSATNPSSTASGAYQFTNGTWQYYAPLAGVSTSQYPTASSAPPGVQDAVFQQAVTQNGLADWTCPGCDAPLTNYLSANPSAASLPILPGGNASQNGSKTGSQTSPDNSASSNSSGCTGWISTPVACITATLTELGFILLALVVIAVGLFLFYEKEV